MHCVMLQNKSPNQDGGAGGGGLQDNEDHTWMPEKLITPS